MSMLGKLKFWHKDELGLNDELAMPKSDLPGAEFGLRAPEMPRPQSEPRIDTFEGARPMYPQQFSQPSFGPNRDLELVSAKLDAIRASLDSINQRLANLERIAYGEENKRGW
ncbi:hypothetical protein HYX10_06050 [Candidatus Woesearchaeota archaeon]|nr:hypothetical protein [Candidatus Woesearchaeota archaeon]